MAALQRGDDVRIITGPYRGFHGRVEEMRSDHARVDVVVPAFGHERRLAFDDSKVERL